MEPHPIRLVVGDDLERSRLTVFFRLLLAIPHLVWLVLWGIAVVLLALVGWVVTLVAGRLPQSLHDFFAAYLRYGTHVYAFVLLAANPFPGFTGTPGSYPIDLEIDGPAEQARWKTAFRIVLAIPALLVTSALLSGSSGGGGAGWEGEDEAYYWSAAAGVAITIAILGWFAALVRGRMPNGFRDALAYCLRYGAQTYGYLLFLTDRYPNANPLEPVPVPAPPRPVAVRSEEDDLSRSRLTVFFRLLLAIPHFVWLALWGIVVLFALLVAWLAALVSGRVPDGLHRFLAAYLRYSVHVLAFVGLVSNPFPGFAGREGTYPVDLHVDPPERQSRWTVLFRLPLALPAIMVDSALTGALTVAAILGWFASVLTGRMPGGLRGLGAWAVGYYGQTYGYLFLLTGRYPYSGPPGLDTPTPVEAAIEPGPAWPEPPPPPLPSS
jgi:hypothetical protein